MVDLLIHGPAVAIIYTTIKAVLAGAATLVKENGGDNYINFHTPKEILLQTGCELWGCIKFLFRHKSHLTTLQKFCEGYFCSVIILSLLIQSITDAGLVKDNLNDLRIQEMMWHDLNLKGLGEGRVSQCRPALIWYSKPWNLWFCLPSHLCKTFQQLVANKSH